MATTHTVPQACPGGKCPSDDSLARLVESPSADTPLNGSHESLGESGDLTEHVGACSGCQARLEAIATGDSSLSGAVHGLDQYQPPHDSAYWRAIAKVEDTLTRTLDLPAIPPAPPSGGAGRPPLPTPRSAPKVSSQELLDGETGETRPLSLDFLQASDVEGMIGRLGPFDIRRVIGRGGMGVVLQGFDPWLHRDVAIKVLDPQLAGTDIARQRFCREARAAAAVSHENLVAVYQVNEDEKSGLPFLVMQLIVGESLEQRLRRVGKLGVAEAVKVGMQTAAGLASAHASGLIHRDIKPGNILIEEATDKAKLTDFGLARAAEDLKLTRTGFVAGTPLYMAPEQARGDDIDARADLFSLGSVLYESLAGRPPFEGRTPLAVLRRVADEAHPPLGKINPDVPAWLETLVDRLLAKDPADRIQTSQEVADTLAVMLPTVTGHPVNGVTPEAVACALSHPKLKGAHRRRVCMRTLAALGVTFATGSVLGGVAALLFLAPGMAPTPPPAPLAPPLALAAPAAPDYATFGPEPLREINAATGAVWSVAVSPDGKTLATGAENGRIALWNIETGSRLGEFHQRDSDKAAHRGPVWSLDFTHDGGTLVSVSDDGTISTWKVATKIREKEIALERSVKSAALSPNGKLVAVGDRAGSVFVFDLAKEESVAQYDQQSTVTSVAFSPVEGELKIASGSGDGKLVIYDLAAKAKVVDMGAHKGPVYGVGFSVDGRHVATASWNPSEAAAVWNVADGTRVDGYDYIKQPEGAWSAQFSPCGGLFVTAGQDGRTRIFDAADGKLIPGGEFARHRGPVHVARFTPDFKLVTGGRDGKVRVWDAAKCAPAGK